MRFVLLLALFLTACGSDRPPAVTPQQTPRPPFGLPIVGEEIEIFTPFDTSTGQLTPATLRPSITLPAGPHEFTWTPVERADGYLVLAADATAVVETDASRFETAIWQWSDESTATVDLGAAGRTLALQIYAYRGVDVVGQSEVWAIETAD